MEFPKNRDMKTTNDVFFPQELLTRYQANLPRYTSYPTAPQFRVGAGEQQFRDSAQLSNSELLPKNLSLYLHIPFCHSLCYFCGCNKLVTGINNPKVERYFDCLMDEITLKSELFDEDRKVTQIHFGGGTPNFMSPNQLGELLQHIGSKFHLDLPNRIEVGIEIDPRSISVEQIYELKNKGFNRFSIGVQDFDPDVQLAVNRIQSPQDTINIIEACMQCSDSVNVDLITGLPHQNLQSFEHTLKRIVRSGVSRIAVYNFAYLPQKIKAQKLICEDALPDDALKLELVKLTHKILGEAGYEHIGMDHFALPSDSLFQAKLDHSLQRNFQGYTTNADTDLIGFGVSAISEFDDAYFQNTLTISEYLQQIDSLDLPVHKSKQLNASDFQRRKIIRAVMCDEHIDLAEITHNHWSHDVWHNYSIELESLRNMEKDGLLIINSTGFEITKIGSLLRRNIASVFDEYLRITTEDDNLSKVVKFSKTL